MSTYIEGMKYLPSMTLREYYAGLAMQGMLSNSYSDGCTKPLSLASNQETAEMAVNQADALIKELEKVRSEG